MKILYVDALQRHCATNASGRIGAYKKVSELYTFDYRAKAKEFGEGVPWSRPEIWHKGDYAPRVFAALYGMNSALIALAEEVQPDLVQIGKGEILFGCAVREIKQRTNAVVVHFYGDLPTEWRERPVKYWVQDIGREADLTLLYYWDERIFKAHLDAGCRRVGFWSAGVDLDIYHPLSVEPSFDVTFIGNHTSTDGVQRLALFHTLAKSGIAVEVFGGGWGGRVKHRNVRLHGHIEADKFAKVSSLSKIVLSHSSNEVRGYCSWNRPLRSMACGAMVLCRYFPGLEEVFGNHVHLVWFHDPEEAVDIVRRYLRDENARQKIAAAGAEEVRRWHTWDERIAELLGYVERIRKDQWLEGQISLFSRRAD